MQWQELARGLHTLSRLWCRTLRRSSNSSLDWSMRTLTGGGTRRFTVGHHNWWRAFKQAERLPGPPRLRGEVRRCGSRSRTGTRRLDPGTSSIREAVSADRRWARRAPSTRPVLPARGHLSCLNGHSRPAVRWQARGWLRIMVSAGSRWSSCRGSGSR